MASLREEMIADLEKRMRHERIRAIFNHWAALLLMIIAILASVVAGVGGLARMLQPVTIGAIAIIPGACALLSQQIKFQGKSLWHYRKLRKLDALDRRLRFEMPNPPTNDQIALISNELTKLNDAIETEWEKSFVMDWGWVRSKGTKH